MLSRRPAWAEPGLQNPGSRTRETLGRAVSSPGAGGVNDHKLGGLTQHKSILLPSRGRSLEGISGDSAHASCGAASLLDTPGRGRGVSSPFPGARVCAHIPRLSAPLSASAPPAPPPVALPCSRPLRASGPPRRLVSAVSASGAVWPPGQLLPSSRKLLLHREQSLWHRLASFRALLDPFASRSLNLSCSGFCPQTSPPRRRGRE